MAITTIGRTGSGPKATAPLSPANPNRQYGVAVYKDARAHEHTCNEDLETNGKHSIAYGPVASEARGGTKFGAYGWKVWANEAPDYYTYFTGNKDKNREAAYSLYHRQTGQ